MKKLKKNHLVLGALGLLAAGAILAANLVGPQGVVYQENGVTLRQVQSFDYDGYILTAAWSPDGKYLTASGQRGRNEVVRDTQTWQPVMTTSKRFADLGGIGFSPDSKYLITSEAGHATSENGLFATIWNIETGQAVEHLSGLSRNVSANAIRFAHPTPDGGHVVIGNGTWTPSGVSIHVLDSKTWEVLRSFGVEKDAEASMAVSPVGSLVATGSYLGRVFVWDYATGEQVKSFPAHKDTVAEMAYTPDGKHLITGAKTISRKAGAESEVMDKDIVRVWDTETLAMVRSYTIGGGTFEVQGISVSPDGRLIAMANGDDLYILDGHSDRVLMARQMPFLMRDVRFSPTGNLLAISAGEKLEVWAVESDDG